MSFFAALLAWLVIAALLVMCVVAATKGMIWLLVLGLVVFFGAFSIWGCATH
jgi:hypothetical protein